MVKDHAALLISPPLPFSALQNAKYSSETLTQNTMERNNPIASSDSGSSSSALSKWTSMPGLNNPLPSSLASARLAAR
ncbi:hypothetical protein N7526_010413 [Penicillium atrosanguineum]|nr:hypothetical protein N7526_010413 [Penicillium atrosanguineum]